MRVLVVDDRAALENSEVSSLFFRLVEEATSNRWFGTPSRVAFDCEGINLCRVGTVELVSVFFEQNKDSVFLVDLSGNRGSRVAALKKLFECESVVKVIHDSRMDGDALYHIHGIVLKNVHDTSCFHYVITGRADAGLNDVLSGNSLPGNCVRDKSIYATNPRFWATRPLTATMINWAGSDVDKLLKLADKQLQALSNSTPRINFAKEKSTEFTKYTRDRKLARGLVCKVNVGRFIGPRGANLRALQQDTQTVIYKDHTDSPFQKETWLVFYNNVSDLSRVKRAMGCD
jgi:3'-5' exonuclease